MNNLKLSLLTGVDLPIKELGIAIHQPTIKEISMMGEEEFFAAAHTLLINKHMLLKFFREKGGPDAAKIEFTDDFSLLKIVLKILDEDATKKRLIQDLFVLLFPHHELIMTPRSFILRNETQLSTIDEETFEGFQTILKKVVCLELSSQGGEFNPAGKQSAEIADKLLRARQRVAAIKAKEGENGSLEQYISSLVIGVASMPLSEVVNLTLYQLYDLLERYSRWSSWDIDVRARLAGAKAEKPLDNWMKQIH